MPSFSLISPIIGSKYFHFSSLFGVVYQKVILCVCCWKIQPYFLRLSIGIVNLQTINCMQRKVFSPFRILIDIEVALPPIFNFFKRSSLIKVPWLQLSSIAKVFTFLLEFLCFTVTGTTCTLIILVFWLIEALLKSFVSVRLFDH